MNQFNQVTLPLAFVNTLMTAMQNHAAGGHVPEASSALPQSNGVPNLLHGLQRQSISGSESLLSQLGGQQWSHPALQAMAAMQQQSGSQSNAPAPQLSVDEVRIANAVIAAMQSASQDPAERDKFTPVVFVPDDERLLVNTLRKAKAEGLTPLQGFAMLDKVSGHTTAAWKDYFIKHIEKLGPKLYQQAYAAHIHTHTSPVLASSISRSTSASEGSLAAPSLPRGAIKSEASSSRKKGETLNVNLLNGGSAGYRPKRGSPVAEYHDETLIPPLPPHTKPKPPRRDPKNDNGRFTKEDKIFFIQYLHYRLDRGPVPSKEELYDELAEQTPHRTAASWKRHWDKACKLPNEIYIAARKRVQSSQSSPVASSSKRSDSQAAQSSGDEPEPEDDSGCEPEEEEAEEEEEEEEEEAEPGAGDHSEYRPTHKRTGAVAAKTKRGKNHGPKHKITENVLRRMARYMVDKREGWDETTNNARWEEFASRPENTYRTLNTWVGITYSRQKKIEAYFQEYLAELSVAGEGPSESAPCVANGIANAGSGGSQPAIKEEKKDVNGSLKRALEGEEAKYGESAPSSLKRPKVEVIYLSD
ncbi:hypothetical protein BD311DRAFT_785481 [Dichomitus squalens]|uniref:DNA-binding protein RAP1 n=1 Tax=Dichomitus squalens TaxID=114155 RepID=A0A4Q9MZG7_9APHY|nr:hypothetical protein BD311DRAFT_785481 [Dichomitus squalens]